MILERKSCVICNENLSLKKTIKNIPLHMGVKPYVNMEDIFFDQFWGECSNCGCVQLMNTIEPNVLYSIDHDPGSQGDIWQQHHLAFANFIIEDNPKAILEIGGSNGYLGSLIVDRIADVPYRIIDPSAHFLDKRISTYRMLFEDYEGILSPEECVVHSHALEHILNPKEFLSKIFTLMPDNGSMYMSFPDMYELLLSNGSNTLCFEHTYYLDINQIKYLLEEIGFDIIKQYNFQSHSYFLKVIKNKNLVRKNKYLEKNFEQIVMLDKVWSQMELFVKETLSKLNDIPTYIFGAHIFSQSLISLGLDHKSIVGVLDDSPLKQGKKLYGYNLDVYPPQKIAGLKNVNIVLRAGKYQSQIRNKLLNINSNATILE